MTTVDMGQVVAARRAATIPRYTDEIRGMVELYGLPWPITELIIAGEIVRRGR